MANLEDLIQEIRNLSNGRNNTLQSLDTEVQRIANIPGYNNPDPIDQESQRRIFERNKDILELRKQKKEFKDKIEKELIDKNSELAFKKLKTARAKTKKKRKRKKGKSHKKKKISRRGKK